MDKCVYCNNMATAEDALGLPACKPHKGEADSYFKQRGGDPAEDTHLYCDDHCDLWQPGCPRCEENSQHYYGMTVAEFRKTPGAKIEVFSADSSEELMEILRETFPNNDSI